MDDLTVRLMARFGFAGIAIIVAIVAVAMFVYSVVGNILFRLCQKFNWFDDRDHNGKPDEERRSLASLFWPVALPYALYLGVKTVLFRFAPMLFTFVFEWPRALAVKFVPIKSQRVEKGPYRSEPQSEPQ